MESPTIWFDRFPTIRTAIAFFYLLETVALISCNEGETGTRNPGNCSGANMVLTIDGGVTRLAELTPLPAGTRNFSVEYHLCLDFITNKSIWLYVSPLHSTPYTIPLKTFSGSEDYDGRIENQQIALSQADDYTIFAILGTDPEPGHWNVRSSDVYFRINTSPRLILWSGGDQKLNEGEILPGIGGQSRFYEGYGLVIQALDANNNPMAGASVTFQSTDGGIQFYPNPTTTGTIREIDGVAATFVNPGLGKRTIEITVSAGFGGQPLLTHLTVQQDAEPGDQQVPTTFTHEKNGTDEVPGDNLDDAHEPAPAIATQKDVFVELDYFSTFSHIGSLTAIRDEVETLWRAKGVYLHVQIGNAITETSTNEYVTENEAKEVLGTNRANPGHMHVIIGNRAEGSWRDNNTYGITVQMGRDDGRQTGYYFMDCANFSSGDPSSRPEHHNRQYYLDRTGVYIFAGHLDDDEYYTRRNGWTVTWVFAWMIAHELGHALGYGFHDPENGVMHVADFGGTYGDYSVVRQITLDLINTRDKLGVETVDSFH